MKVTELKIGDLVNFGGDKARVISNSLEYERTVKVERLEYRDGEPPWIASLLDEIDPIPITSEILEKNGWKKEECPEGIIYTNGWYRLSRAEQEGSWMFNHYDDFLTTIQSVHELQHLLWVLGIDDDLKI